MIPSDTRGMEQLRGARMVLPGMRGGEIRKNAWAEWGGDGKERGRGGGAGGERRALGTERRRTRRLLLLTHKLFPAFFHVLQTRLRWL